MIKIGKICLLTEGEISKLKKKFLEIETKLEQISFDLAKNFMEHDTISRVFDRFGTKNFDRIKRMADIIMPTLPIAKRKALAKLFATPQKAAADKQTNANVNTNTESK